METWYYNVDQHTVYALDADQYDILLELKNYGKITLEEFNRIIQMCNRAANPEDQEVAESLILELCKKHEIQNDKYNPVKKKSSGI